MNLDTWNCTCGSTPTGAINYERHLELTRDVYIRAEAAEARVKVLEEALRKIERYCKAALAAKEKP